MTRILRRATGVQVCWTEQDRYSLLAPAATVGLALAVLLAVVGLPPISIHGPFHFVGIMDPLCGMTRGSVAMVRGELRRAVWFNPASPLVPIGGAAVLLRAAYGVRTGRWLDVRLVAPRLTLVLFTVLISMLQVNQQLHVSRLRG